MPENQAFALKVLTIVTSIAFTIGLLLGGSVGALITVAVTK